MRPAAGGVWQSTSISSTKVAVLPEKSTVIVTVVFSSPATIGTL